MEASGTVGGNVRITGTSGLSVVGKGEVEGRVEIENSPWAFVVHETAPSVLLHGNTGSFDTDGILEVDSNTISREVSVYENSPDGTGLNLIEILDNHLPTGKAHVYENSPTPAAGTNHLIVGGNQLGSGSLTLDDNTVDEAVSEEMAVYGNTVSKDLACYGNSLPPVRPGSPQHRRASEGTVLRTVSSTLLPAAS
jgi:hypothetical protein